MMDSIRAIQAYSDGLVFPVADSSLHGDAILWQLCRLGETAKIVSRSGVSGDKLKPLLSLMAKTRDRLIHHPELIEWHVIALTVRDDLPVALDVLVASLDSTV